MAVYDKFKDNPFLKDPSKFDLENEKAVEFIGIMVNGDQTLLKEDAGFFNPITVNSTGAGVGQADDNSYRVSEVAKDNKEEDIRRVLGSSSKEKAADKTVYIYEYSTYKASAISNVTVSGMLTGVKDTENAKTITVAGTLQIALDNKTPPANKPIYVYFGDPGSRPKSEDSVVFDKNNVAQSGKIAISYTKPGQTEKKVKKFDISSLSEEQRKELTELGFFKIKEAQSS